jgi:dipeptidyl aminopeptidase/acylaminoacyl peptidase
MTDPQNRTPWHDLDVYLALPRISGLAVSRDGSRVVLAVSQLDEQKTKFVSALWEADSAGERRARRISFSERGESAPVFAADGSLLFLSSRGSGEGGEDPPASVWRLPAEGGEASEIAKFPGSASGVLPAGAAQTVVVTAATLSGASSLAEDARLRALRKEAKVSAVLHTGYPVRFWDHDLGPEAPRLWALGSLGADPADITPRPVGSQVTGGGLRETSADLAVDGSFLVTSFVVPGERGSSRTVLMRVEVATGHSRVLLDDPEGHLLSPKISPDRTQVAYLRESLASPQQAPRCTLHLLSLADGTTHQLTPQWDLWPNSLAWSPGGEALFVGADEQGRAPVFRVALDGSDDGAQPTRITTDDFAYSCIAPTSGGSVFALRSSFLRAPHPVRIAADGSVAELPSPSSELALPGVVEELATALPTGERVRSWLVLPAETEKAPLVLWVHGGPLSSWNAWSWRWNPWLLAARGYALLLPDPALSTGYGQSFIQRGWGDWGGAAYTDIMAAVDAALEHPCVDETRAAAMGGSFGGYMANWIAGHTDRFRAIVTHASLWALDQFGATTDDSSYWLREMTPQMALANSPHLHAENIRTPMLVVHGDKDYRVPVGEGLRLWWDLMSRSPLGPGDDGLTPHRFLFFPNENHWVLSPQHAKLWYQVVLAFLDEHLLGGSPGPIPEALGR